MGKEWERQNTLLKIVAKQYLGSCWGGGGGKCFIEDSRKAIFRELVGEEGRILY